MYNFINDKYVIDFEVPVGLQDFIDEAEKADKENDLGTYAVYADAIDVAAKNCYGAGLITKKMWDTLIRRYAL